MPLLCGTVKEYFPISNAMKFRFSAGHSSVTPASDISDTSFPLCPFSWPLFIHFIEGPDTAFQTVFEMPFLFVHVRYGSPTHLSRARNDWLHKAGYSCYKMTWRATLECLVTYSGRMSVNVSGSVKQWHR